jgi:hypothetical protein
MLTSTTASTPQAPFDPSAVHAIPPMKNAETPSSASARALARHTGT